MPRFAADPSPMYGEHDFLDRYGAVAADGFDAVKFLFPYDRAPEDIAAARVAPLGHAPDGGEVNHSFPFALLDEIGYAGFVGCEYRPRAGTSAGLGWLRRWREAQAGTSRPPEGGPL